MNGTRAIVTAIAFTATLGGYGAIVPEASGADAPSASSQADIAYLAARRAELGLPADTSTVVSILNSGKDVGSLPWGIPMSQEEALAVDLPGRMTFADDVDQKLLASARKLGTFAGAFVEPNNDGNIVVLLTRLDADVIDELNHLAPMATE